MKAWFIAILLHLSLLGFLIAWPHFGKIESLPKNTGGIPAFLAGSAALAQSPSGMSQVQKQKPAAASKSIASNKLVGANQAVSQQIASQAMQALLNEVSRDIQAHLSYPNLAQSHIEQGAAIVAFDLQPDGKISNIVTSKSSGSEDLDQAAIEAVQESSPISMPIHLNQAIHLSLPVDFSLE
jgi:protein TonB